MTEAGIAVKFRDMARILVIEDDAELQQALSFALFKFNYDANYAFNGKEGYEKIISLRPDVVLLDLMLPILSGIEVIKLVTSNTSIREIPIIVMTAHGDQADLLEHSVKASGVREYIRKPFPIEELLKLIKRTIAQYPQEHHEETQISKGTIRMDLRFRTVWVNDKLVATLPIKRAEVLKALLKARGPVKREKLLETVWGDSDKLNTLEKTIQRLRMDLGPLEGARIQTTADGYELLG